MSHKKQPRRKGQPKGQPKTLPSQQRTESPENWASRAEAKLCEASASLDAQSWHAYWDWAEREFGPQNL